MSSLRTEMPAAAALVDELRTMFGAELVNTALRAGVALQREHAARVARDGQAAADAWLDAQPGSGPVLRVSEAGRTVGELPGRQPAPLQAPRRARR